MNLRRAVVTLLIKKASLHGNELKTYHPVSGICFLSVLVEQVVAKQWLTSIEPSLTILSNHSSEITLLSIKNYVHLTIAWSQPMALMILDLSATVDAIDHQTLLNHLTDSGLVSVVLP